MVSAGERGPEGKWKKEEDKVLRGRKRKWRMEESIH